MAQPPLCSNRHRRLLRRSLAAVILVGAVGSAGQSVADAHGPLVAGPCLPTLADDAYTTPFDTTLSVGAPGVGSNDPDSCGLPYELFASTSSGTLSFSADGSFVYTPNAGFIGVDVFQYTVQILVPTFRSGFAAGWRTPQGIARPVATVTITIEGPPPTTTTTTTTVPATTTTVPAATSTTVPPVTTVATTVPPTAPPTTVASSSSGNTLPATQ